MKSLITSTDLKREILLAVITAVTVYFVTKKIKQWDEKRA